MLHYLCMWPEAWILGFTIVFDFFLTRSYLRIFFLFFFFVFFLFAELNDAEKRFELGSSKFLSDAV